MDLNYTGVNWVAVIAATVAYSVIGFVWFSRQVFGLRWAASIGRELPAPGQVPVTSLVGSVVVGLVSAYVLALLSGAAGAATLVDGVKLGFLAWLGFAATSSFGGVLFEGRNTTWWTISAGYWLVALVVMGAIIGYWQ
jgi:Protein of unknown function (DUF1761)